MTLRDQRSNDKASRDLQADIRERFGNSFFMQVKSGEVTPPNAEVVDNTLVAQYIMAVYLAEPWAAVRKLRLFDQDFRRIFNRSISADKVYLLKVIDDAVGQERARLRADLASSYASVRFTLLHLVAELLRASSAGNLLLDAPERFVADSETLERIRASLNDIAYEVIEGVNDYIGELLEENDNFDPKVAFKSQSGVTKITKQIMKDAARQARRGDPYYFAVTPAF